MMASFGIAMVGVAAMVAALGALWIKRDADGSLELTGFAVVALFAILASCVASH